MNQWRVSVSLLLAVCSVVLIMSSCGAGDEPVLNPLTVDEISGERLWTRITEENDWSNWNQWSAHSGMQPGQSPHGVWHEVYGNRTLFGGLPSADRSTPFGSIIVKENYDAEKKLGLLAVMAKVESWDPENGDWFWALYDQEGGVVVEGSVDGCISCHSGMKSNDYVIINPLDEAP